MTYTEKTPSYNDRRYGKPWMAIVTTSLSRDFAFIDWDGRPGYAGQFQFEAEPGTLLAYGQKDLRKGRGGIDGYQICLPDGSLPALQDSYAAELRPLPLEARWRTVAEGFLRAASQRPKNEWQVAEWAKTYYEDAARYSAMLGVPNPVLAEIADTLGLIDHEPEPQAVVANLSAFGF